MSYTFRTRKARFKMAIVSTLSFWLVLQAFWACVFAGTSELEFVSFGLLLTSGAVSAFCFTVDWVISPDKS